MAKKSKSSEESKDWQEFKPEQSKDQSSKSEPKPSKANVVSRSSRRLSQDADSGVLLRVFLAASGMKFDQSAGFSAYAKSMGFNRKPMNEWHASYAEFMSKITG